MPLYRKKPVVIEAMKYTEETRDEVIEWSGAGHQGMDDDGCLYELLNLRIETHEGEVMASPGDWVIKDIGGQYLTCKPEIFEATYEPVEG